MFFSSGKSIKAGVTLVEILVVSLILGGIGAAVYSIISQARFVATRTQALGDARQDAMIVLRYMERDISNSRAEVDPNDRERMKISLLEMSTEPSDLKMLIPRALSELSGNDESTYFDHEDTDEDNYVEVNYVLSDGSIRREVTGGPVRTLSSLVDHFEFSVDYQNRIRVDLFMENEVKGFNRTVKHHERTIFTVRQAAQLEDLDSHWRQRIDPSDF